MRRLIENEANIGRTNQSKELEGGAEEANIHGIAIEHVADLEVHGPIGSDQHLARRSLHHSVHHLRFDLNKQNSKEKRREEKRRIEKKQEA